MRNIVEVVNKMLMHIPETEINQYLISDLERIASSAIYAAPESQRFWWEELSNVVNTSMPTPDKLNIWQKHMIDIFQDKA